MMSFCHWLTHIFFLTTMVASLLGASTRSGIPSKTLNPQFIKSKIASIFQIYTTNDAALQARLIRNEVNPNITFEDPLMIVEGAENYRVEFKTLISLFEKVTITSGVNSSDGYRSVKPGSLGNNSIDIIVDNTQLYEFNQSSWFLKSFLPPLIKINVTTTLTLAQDETNSSLDGQVLKHRDVWLEHNENSFYRGYMKNTVGSLTSSILRLFGY